VASLARAIAVAPLTLALACAGLAGLEEPEPQAATSNDAAIVDGAPDGDAPSPTLSPPPDASVDAPVEAAACKRAPIDQTCKANDECCSGACKMNRRCASSCIAPAGDCITDLRVFDCCVGLYCSNQTRGTCAPCRAGGTLAEAIDAKPKDYSCCSGELNGAYCR
jgi:hypothetical protein